MHSSAFIGLAIAATALASCEVIEREIDPFPVTMETRSGAVFVGVSGGDGVVRAATVDTLSPITVIDTSVDEAAPATRLAADLTLHSVAGVPRVTFSRTEVFDLHPCDSGGPYAPCSVGLDGDTTELRGIIGTNVLSKQSVRFDFAANELTFFPDTAGTNNDRSELCEALFEGPFAGGGTLVVADGEVEYLGNRPALGACLDVASPLDTVEPDNVVESGADALLVLSTGIGPSILSETAYNRYAAEIGGPPASELADAVLQLPSGPVGAKRGSLGHVTLVGEVGSDSQNRGPCRELFANQAMAQDLCNRDLLDDCPCPDTKTFCRAAGALLLAGPIDVAVLPDEHPTLQALRVELRPDFPEVDGILGASALQSTRLDFDYPNSRIMGRCTSDATCVSRPQVSRLADRDEVLSCLSEPSP